MMTSPVSGSSGPVAARPSDAFACLHPGVQRWVHRQGWDQLRGIQEQAIRAIIEGGTDVIISAGTARGKTEAAFLPLCSRVAAEPGTSVRVLCVSPLKALINDQYERLERLCEDAGIPIHRWHGDVAATAKARAVKEPGGLLLITPESLEALFVRKSGKLATLFGDLDHVVVDELHAFVGSERGRQLQSLLHRIELAVRRRVPRIGLSATIGDMDLASEFLRVGGGAEVCRIVDADAGDPLKLQVRGYRATSEPPASGDGKAEPGGDVQDIAAHLFKTLRGADNLVFANRRGDVEVYADLLRRLSERAKVPNEFHPHHGSLSKELREEAEARLKDKRLPVTVVCTSTLELGIDVGDVKSVAQLGPPPSVASMRQRLGRSGRRGEPAILRIYVREQAIDTRTPPTDAIRVGLVQSIAMVDLLLERWCEPPAGQAPHLSTLVHQILSVLAQHGGARAPELWRALCGSGPFRAVDQPRFGALLRGLGTHDLITQDGDGTLVMGLAGERLVNHYSFWAVFSTPVEYRLVAQGRSLGTLPIDHAVGEGSFLIFGGRRWRVVAVDGARKVVDLVPAPGGKAPVFGGHGAQVHDTVRRSMQEVYQGLAIPTYLDEVAIDLLAEARTQFDRLGLRERTLVAFGRDTVVFPWCGDRALDTLVLALQTRGLQVARDAASFTVVDEPPEAVADQLQALAASGIPDIVSLASIVRVKAREKFHAYLPELLLDEDFAATWLDLEGAQFALERLITGSYACVLLPGSMPGVDD